MLSRGPHGYYGILAARRVREKPPAPIAAARQAHRRSGRSSCDREPRYQRALALGSVGFDGFAILELETLGRDAAGGQRSGVGARGAFADLGEAGRSLRYLRRALGPAVEAGAPGHARRDSGSSTTPSGTPSSVRSAARSAGLDPYFVAAVIREESSYDPRARSGVGAVGLMQLMPDTARLVAQEPRATPDGELAPCGSRR